MNQQSEEKLRLCVRTIHDLQKGTSVERNGVDTSEKDGSVIIRFPIELESSGETVRCTLILGEHFTQLYSDLKSSLEARYCVRAVVAANAANQAMRFGHIAVDSRDGRVFYTLAQLAANAESVPGALAVGLMELNDWYSPLLDFLDTPMERQDLEDFLETAGQITHTGDNTLPLDELYDEEEDS